MEAVWKTVRIVACVLAGVGVALACAGFVLSGFDARVFSATIDRGMVTLGGTVIDDPGALPGISTLAEMGRVEYGGSAGEEIAEETPAASEADEK